MKTDERVSLWTVKQPIKMRDSGGMSLKKKKLMEKVSNVFEHIKMCL